jgi:8-oxo-dGTP pyrophosphatase MutT (NUDIX family)
MSLEKHYTATVYILSDSRPAKALLLHHRKLDHWLPPGGHQESHENAWETAIREVREETGLDISNHIESPIIVDEHRSYLPVPSMMTQHRIFAYGDEPEHFHLDMEYVVRIPEQQITFNEAESRQIDWFTLEEIQGLKTFPDILTFLTEELSK